MRTRDASMPATWNRDRVIVRAFVRHLQQRGAALELPALGHRRTRPDTTRALSSADVERILQAPAPAPLRERTLWRLLTRTPQPGNHGRAWQGGAAQSG